MAYERIAEFHTSNNKHRVYDVDENGDVVNSTPWKNLPITGDTSLSPLDLWKDAVIVTWDSIPEVIGDVVQVRRKL